MRKITFVLLLVFITIIQIPLLTQYIVSELEGAFSDNCAFMDIKNIGKIKDVKEFSSVVSEFSEKHNAFVATIGYKAQADLNELTDLMISGKNIPQFLENRGISHINLNDLYDNKTKDLDLKMFNPTKRCLVNSFDELKGKSLSRTYYIYPKSSGTIFKEYMESNYDVLFYSSDDLLYISSGYYEQLPGIAVLAAALLVFWAFWIVSEYQYNAVKKLHGYSDTICKSTLFGKYVKTMLSAFLAVFICEIIGLGFYNHWTNLKAFLFDAVKICIPVIAGALFAALIFVILFYSSDVTYALKGKKPHTVLTVCAASIKAITIVFLCYSVIYIGNYSSKAKEIYKQEDNFKKVASYRMTEWRLESGESKYLKEFEEKGSNFYHQFSGVLMNNKNIIDGLYACEYGYESELTPLDKTVFINDEYLHVNPIYDTKGNLVSINSDIASNNKITVLVPEKYLKDEAVIRQSLTEWYKFSRYLSLPYVEQDEKDVQVDILYVADEQTYFAFSPRHEHIRNNYIKDPFAVIVTNNNMDISIYANSVCNGEFYISDRYSADEILKTAKELGIENELFNIPIVSSAVENLMNNCKNTIIASTVLLVVSFFISGIICTYIVQNYMEKERKLLFVKKMLGYPPYKIYGLFITVSLVLDILLFFILKFALNIPWLLWLIVFALFVGFDVVLMSFIVLIYQKKLNKDTLKGECI